MKNTVKSIISLLILISTFSKAVSAQEIICEKTASYNNRSFNCSHFHCSFVEEYYSSRQLQR